MMRSISTRMATYGLGIVSSILLLPFFAAAQEIPVTELQGYGWSDNVGYIFFSCKDVLGNNICATSDFGVMINANREIEGWAWSPNIGWIRFGRLDVTESPSGSLITQSTNAVVTGPLNALQFNGWARACGGITGNLNACTSNSNGQPPYRGINPSAGGWEGWISLSGLTTIPGNDYKVVINLNRLRVEPESYAWGGMVTGWINMQQMVLVPVAGTNRINGVDCFIPDGSNSCTTSVNWEIVATSTNPNVRNTRTNTTINTGNHRGDQSITITYGDNPFHARDGSNILATDVVRASCNLGSNHNGSVCIGSGNPGIPTITLQMEPRVVRMGARSAARWTISDLTGSTCVLNGPGFSNTPVTSLTGLLPTNPLAGVSTFRLTCTSNTGAYTPVEVRSTAEVVPVAAEV